MQGFFHPLLPIPAVQEFDFVLHGGQVAFARGVAVNQVTHVLQAGAYRLRYRRVAIELRLLRYKGHAQALLDT